MKIGDVINRLLPLLEDARWAEVNLEKEDNQYTRRAYVRSLFALIEGSIWVLKEIMLKATSINGTSIRVSFEEFALLSEKSIELKSNGEPKVQTKHLKLPENIRFTFKMAGKVFGRKFNLGVGTQAWENFIKAQAIRNRIIHPRHLEDFNISDDEKILIQAVCSWYNILIKNFFGSIGAFDQEKKQN